MATSLIRHCRIRAWEGTYENLTFENAAKQALTDYFAVRSVAHTVFEGPRVDEVEVSDPESGVTRRIKLKTSVEMRWINPREGVDY